MWLCSCSAPVEKLPSSRVILPACVSFHWPFVLSYSPRCIELWKVCLQNFQKQKKKILFFRWNHNCFFLFKGILCALTSEMYIWNLCALCYGELKTIKINQWWEDQKTHKAFVLCCAFQWNKSIVFSLYLLWELSLWLSWWMLYDSSVTW